MRVVFIAALAYLALVAVIFRKRLPQLHPRRFFLETWREVDREAAAERAVRALRGAGYDWRPIVAFISAAVVLTLQEYFGNQPTFSDLITRGWVIEWGGGVAHPATHHLHLLAAQVWARSPRYGDLYALGYWSLSRSVGYFVVPATIILLFWRGERLRDFGLRTKGFVDHAWIYALFFGIVLCVVVLVSQTSEFSTYYPFYKDASRSWYDFFCWECLYATQFFTLEFFFRGYLIFSGRRAMGSAVLMAMVVPYCMIHFGKPWPEALAAILAGTVLGTLSLKTRNIYSGFCIHVTVAISMDLAAMLQTRGLPGGIHLPASWGW